MAKQINLQQQPGETLQQLYTRLAKVADQRLVRLEKLTSEEGFQTATQWSYARAMKDIEKWGGDQKGKPRFNKGMPKNDAQLRAKINDIRTFLNAPSSTKEGITKIYQKRADTFNRMDKTAEGKGGFGTQFTWEDLAKYYLGGYNKKFEKIAGSETILKAIGLIQRSKDPQAMAAEAWKNTKRTADQRIPVVEGDPIMDKVVQSLLRKRSLRELLDI